MLTSPNSGHFYRRQIRPSSILAAIETAAASKQIIQWRNHLWFAQTLSYRSLPHLCVLRVCITVAMPTRAKSLSGGRQHASTDNAEHADELHKHFITFADDSAPQTNNNSEYCAVHHPIRCTATMAINSHHCIACCMCRHARNSFIRLASGQQPICKIQPRQCRVHHPI